MVKAWLLPVEYRGKKKPLPQAPGSNLQMPPRAPQVLEINEGEPIERPDPSKGVDSYSVMPASSQMWPKGVGPISSDLHFQENLDASAVHHKCVVVTDGLPPPIPVPLKKSKLYGTYIITPDLVYLPVWFVQHFWQRILVMLDHLQSQRAHSLTN